MKSFALSILELYCGLANGKVDSVLLIGRPPDGGFFHTAITNPAGDHGLHAEMLFDIPGNKLTEHHTCLLVYDPAVKIADEPGRILLECNTIDALDGKRVLFNLHPGWKAQDVSRTHSLVAQIIAQRLTEIIRRGSS